MHMLGPEVPGTSGQHTAAMLFIEARLSMLEHQHILRCSCTFQSLDCRQTTMAMTALQAVAAVLQQDQSAIVTLKSSKISRPSQLDDKVYASYGAR